MLSGCFRTHYINLYAEEFEPTQPHSGREESKNDWQNFWIFGLVPSDIEIDASDVCGMGHVQEIETERSFLQGFLTALTSVYYINIYSPWTGKIRCFDP